MSESETNPMKSTINPWGNPKNYVPPERAESNPNMSVLGFIEESLYTGPGTCLQSQQEGIECNHNGRELKLEPIEF